MTRQEYRLVRLLNKLTSKSDICFFYDSNDLSFHLQNSPDQKILSGKLSSEIHSLLQSLLDKQLIKSIPVHGVDGDKYCLTHKGIHYAQFTAGKIISFLIKSILVPILVAVLTALITLYTKGLI